MPPIQSPSGDHLSPVEAGMFWGTSSILHLVHATVVTPSAWLCRTICVENNQGVGSVRVRVRPDRPSSQSTSPENLAMCFRHSGDKIPRPRLAARVGARSNRRHHTCDTPRGIVSTADADSHFNGSRQTLVHAKWNHLDSVAQIRTGRLPNLTDPKAQKQA